MTRVPLHATALHVVRDCHAEGAEPCSLAFEAWAPMKWQHPSPDAAAPAGKTFPHFRLALLTLALQNVSNRTVHHMVSHHTSSAAVSQQTEYPPSSAPVVSDTAGRCLQDTVNHMVSTHASAAAASAQGPDALQRQAALMADLSEAFDAWAASTPSAIQAFKSLQAQSEAVVKEQQQQQVG